MRSSQSNRSGFAWLELLLLLAMLALVLQLMPGAWQSLLDFRRWPRIAWIALNASIVLLLVGVRFGPDLVNNWRQQRAQKVAKHASSEKQEEMKRQRESLEQMRQARKRRIY